MKTTVYIYAANLERIVDGDTLDLRVDLGFRLSTIQRFRLLDVDTPERGHPEWRTATDSLRALVAAAMTGDRHGRLLISTTKTDSFGRWLVAIEDGRGGTINAHLAARWPWKG